MDDLMPIGEFSRRSGLSAKRLRSYAAGGVLVPAAIDTATGYRYYSPGQLRDAQVIDALRRAGLPVVEIATVLRHRSLEQFEEWSGQVDTDASQRHEALNEAARLLADEPSIDVGNTTSRREGMSTSFRSFARSDVGPVRQNNEDAVLCRDDLIAVADGMGGAPGGELASAVAVSLLDAAFTGRSLDELEAAGRAANRAIFDQAVAHAELEGMGTTLCAVGTLEDGRLAVINIGDSRAYLLREGALRQLTDDHSVTADLIRRGELTEREAVGHPHRNVLTRVLGIAPTADIDAAVHSARPGDRLLLCSDGLFNEVPETELRPLMEASEDLTATADALVDRAVANGGRDNVSVVIAEVVS